MQLFLCNSVFCTNFSAPFFAQPIVKRLAVFLEKGCCNQWYLPAKMTKDNDCKKRIKLIISIGATLVAVAHLIFPNVSIDIITVVLIALAIIPWLETLFKSVELPGGVKLEFQELEKIEKEAKKIGLISTEEETETVEDDKDNPKYYFVEIAEINQELALVSLRIEIEKRLREIATKYSIDTQKYSVIRLIDALVNKNVLTIQDNSFKRHDFNSKSCGTWCRI